MTDKELNRDIKRLYCEHYSRTFENIGDFFKWWEAEGRPESMRLYNADKKAERINLNSFKAMCRLNISRRIIPFHIFYIEADPKY